MTGDRIILIQPGMFLWKFTKHQIPGARGRAMVLVSLTEYPGLHATQRTSRRAG